MSSGEQERSIGRRAVLKAVGGAALAGAAGFGAAPAANADETGRSADVIIIGAGYAGVTAARDLRKAGLRPVLLEARDRIGGRTWSTGYEGETIELGGAYVSDVHTNVMAELARYGIGTVPGNPLPERAFWPSAGGGQQELDFLTANARLETLLGQLFAGSETYFPMPRDPLYARDVLARYDPLSLRDRMNQLPLSAEDRLWLSGVTAGYSGGSSATGGLTAFAQAWEAGDHRWIEVLEYRIAGGTGALLNAMLTDAGVDLRLNSPVVSVVEEYGRVVVTTRAGARFYAPAVVVAVPVNVWRTIAFAPGLPAVHTAATNEGVGVPNAAKLLIRLGGDIRAPFGLSPEGSPMWMIVPQAELSNGDQLVVGFSVDPTINLTSLADVQARVRTILPGATVRAFRAHSWSRDRWALGGWGLRKPNQLIRQWPAIQQPHGRVVFASGDVSAVWHGYIDGAIEGGKVAAVQALSLV
jgi:monoamine oxidase